MTLLKKDMHYNDINLVLITLFELNNQSLKILKTFMWPCFVALLCCLTFLPCFVALLYDLALYPFNLVLPFLPCFVTLLSNLALVLLCGLSNLYLHMFLFVCFALWPYLWPCSMAHGLVFFLCVLALWPCLVILIYDPVLNWT